MKTWEIVAAFVALFVVLNIAISSYFGRRRKPKVTWKDNDLYERMTTPEVTSCILCERPLPRHDKGCPILAALEFASPQEIKALDAYLAAQRSGDAGDALPTPPPPNIGGEGRPDYQGPHYDVEHPRFVPYEMLHEPIPGTAVRQMGVEAEVEDMGDAQDSDSLGSEPIREEDHSSKPSPPTAR